LARFLRVICFRSLSCAFVDRGFQEAKRTIHGNDGNEKQITQGSKQRYCLLPIAYAYCLLPTAYCLLPAAGYTAFPVKITQSPCDVPMKAAWAAITYVRAESGRPDAPTLVGGRPGACKPGDDPFVVGQMMPVQHRNDAEGATDTDWQRILLAYASP
jgi:hypothetical protein